MEYEVELAQIGRRGTAFCETNFGLSFTIDLVRNPKINKTGRYPRVIGQKKERVFQLLSPCCSSVFDLQSKSQQIYGCHTCKKPCPWPNELLEIELARDTVKAAEQLEPILAFFDLDTLESIYLTNSLMGVIEEVFAKVAAGERLRSVIALKSKEVI